MYKQNFIKIHSLFLKIEKNWNFNNLGHTVSLFENMTLMHQTVLEIQDKITWPWNIGHIDLHLFLGQTSGHTDLQSQSMMFIHEIVSKM